MECNYGGGLFLEFQPLTDRMLCEDTTGMTNHMNVKTQRKK